MSRLRGKSVAGITVVLGLSMLAIAEPSNQSNASAGLRINLGPDGKPSAALSAQDSTPTTTSVTFRNARESKDLYSLKAPKGEGTMVKLNGRFQSATYATIGSDGKLKTTCVPAEVSAGEEKK